jgi:hypothetical protein
MPASKNSGTLSSKEHNMKRFRSLMYLTACVAAGLMVTPAYAGIFGRCGGGGCNVGGCNAGGCNVGGGCNVSSCQVQTNANTAVPDQFQLGAVTNPVTRDEIELASRPIIRRNTTPTPPPAAMPPQVVKGEQGPAGPQGPKGEPGAPAEWTPELIKQVVAGLKESVAPLIATQKAEIVNEVVGVLKTDPAFRGQDAAPINIENVATAVAEKVDLDVVAQKAAMMIKLPEVDEDAIAKRAAAMVKVPTPEEIAAAVAVNAPTPAAKEVWYFTSKGATTPELQELDREVYALKAQGKDIVVVKHDPDMTRTKDVPKVYTADRKTISGLPSVASYMKSLK